MLNRSIDGFHSFPMSTQPHRWLVYQTMSKRSGRVPYHQVLMTSPDDPNKYRLFSLSLASATGVLSLSSRKSLSDRKARENEVAYAAPLCTSRDGSHVFVVYPIDNVSFVSPFVLAVRLRVAVEPCLQARPPRLLLGTT